MPEERSPVVEIVEVAIAAGPLQAPLALMQPLPASPPAPPFTPIPTPTKIPAVTAPAPLPPPAPTYCARMPFESLPCVVIELLFVTVTILPAPPRAPEPPSENKAATPNPPLP